MNTNDWALPTPHSQKVLGSSKKGSPGVNTTGEDILTPEDLCGVSRPRTKKDSGSPAERPPDSAFREFCGF